MKNKKFIFTLLSLFVLTILIPQEFAIAAVNLNPPPITLETAPHSAKPKAKKSVKKTTKRNLKLGMTGNDVVVLQNFLIKKNTGPAAKALAKNKATGRFGPLTQEALEEFQKAKGLTADGVAGAKIRALYNA